MVVLSKLLPKLESKSVEGFVTACNDQESIGIISTTCPVNSDVSSELEGIRIFKQIVF